MWRETCMDLRVSAVFAPKALFMVAGVIELRERETKVIGATNKRERD
jgi:hypothetical protein